MGEPEAAGRRPAALLFSYSAGDGEFTFSLSLRDDGAWERTEHSGSAAPEGRLPRRALAHFLALLDAAAFAERSDPACDGSRPGYAAYTDHRGDRRARAQSGCAPAVDEATARLPGCLELLISDPNAGIAACPAPAE